MRFLKDIIYCANKNGKYSYSFLRNLTTFYFKVNCFRLEMLRFVVVSASVISNIKVAFLQSHLLRYECELFAELIWAKSCCFGTLLFLNLAVLLAVVPENTKVDIQHHDDHCETVS